MELKVWLVAGGFDYESAQAQAVCSSEKKAEDLRAQWEATGDFDWVSAIEYTVDGHEPDYSHCT